MSRESLPDVGIEALAAHIPRYYLDLGTLARANGVDPAKYQVGLGCRRMAVPAPDEDPVVLAAGATARLFDAYRIDPANIGLLVVGTESGVDGAKPIAAYVHRMAGLPATCRAFDVQHACYGSTAALTIAADWVAGGRSAGRKALVVAADITRYDVGSPGEPTQGAGAVALLVGPEPRVLRLERHPEAVHAEEVMDFWRPHYRDSALVDGHYSLECYLHAAESCWRRYREGTRAGFPDFDFLLFHSPFPKMARKAHRRLFDAAMRDGDVPAEADPAADFERRVLPSLWANAEIGNAYTASLYLSLAGLLEHRAVRCAGARIGLFSYGSGSCAEFLAARVGDDEAAWRGRTGLHELLDARRELTHRTYLRFRKEQADLAHGGSLRPPLPHRGLAFCGTRDDRRVYRDAESTAAPVASDVGGDSPAAAAVAPRRTRRVRNGGQPAPAPPRRPC